MSFATVYNTLDTLARTGLAGTVRLPGKRGDAARFDPEHRRRITTPCATSAGPSLDIAGGHARPHAGRREEASPGGARLLGPHRRAHLPRAVRAVHGCDAAPALPRER